jgi:hypothetical protein
VIDLLSGDKGDKPRCRPLTELERRVWLWENPPPAENVEARKAWLLARWKLDPVCYVVEACRGTPHLYQAQILLDLFDAPLELYDFYGCDPTFPKSQVLAPSGHGLGKTRLLAWAIWNHLDCHPFSYTLATAPTAPQLTGRLWGEMAQVRRRTKQAHPWLTRPWSMLGDKIVHENPDFADWTVVARTARAEQPEALQGAHALDADDEFGDLAELFGETRQASRHGGILVVIEEASGVDNSIREVLEGALSESGARLIAPGNPTRADGWFAADLDKTDRYAVHPLDCRLSNRKNVYSIPYRDFGGRVRRLRIRGFVDPAYWEGILSDCDGDEDRDRFRVRVRGLKPRSNTTQVLQTEWVDAALRRDPDPSSAAEPVVVSLDVGATNDHHALAVRQGFTIRYLDEWLPKNEPNQDQVNALTRLIEAVLTFNAAVVIGDSNGVGRGVMQIFELLARSESWEEVALADLAILALLKKALGIDVTALFGRKIRVIHFIAGERATDPKRYMRRRDEMWYKYGRAFFSDPRCSVPNRPGLKSQLIAPQFEEDEVGRIRVETKQEIENRTKQANGTAQKSGNSADAILQSLIPKIFVAEEKPAPPQSPLPDAFRKHFERFKNSRRNSVYIR